MPDCRGKLNKLNKTEQKKARKQIKKKLSHKQSLNRKVITIYVMIETKNMYK
jgi:hypothetical protein